MEKQPKSIFPGEGEPYSISEWIPVIGNLGITRNLVGKPNGRRYYIINCVEQHDPKPVETDAGTVSTNTLTRIADDNFPDIASARSYILSLQG